MTDSGQLLTRYHEDRDEAAFAELVQCEIDLVYGTAVRQLRDAELARDVTQIVFRDLARKAATFSGQTVISGWLYRHACFIAAKVRRQERRRHIREEKAMESDPVGGAEEDGRRELAPVLDQAMQRLSANDRNALVLRFFRECSLAEVGQGLGIQENAARMRVDRALQRLRAILVKNGFASSSEALIALLPAMTGPAPGGLAGAVTAAAIAAQTGSSMISLGILATMNTTKISVGLAAAALAVGIGSPWLAHKKVRALQAENATLRQQVAEWRRTRQGEQPPSPSAAEAVAIENQKDSERRELLRLRGELAGLRQQMRGLQNQTGEGAGVAPAVEAMPEPAPVIAPGAYAADTWTNEGFGSPQNSALTFLWSLRHGEAKAFSDALGKTNLQRLPIEWASEMRRIKQTEISETKVSADGRPEINLVHELEDGTVAQTWLGFTNVNNAWLIKQLSGYPIVLYRSPSKSSPSGDSQ